LERIKLLLHVAAARTLILNIMLIFKEPRDAVDNLWQVIPLKSAQSKTKKK
jgi:hypothetical protein